MSARLRQALSTGFYSAIGGAALALLFVLGILALLSFAVWAPPPQAVVWGGAVAAVRAWTTFEP